MWKQALFVAALAVIASAEQGTRRAIVFLRHPNCANKVEGTIIIEEKDGKAHVTGKVTGMPPGKFGFTIHEKGDITNACTKTGDHFNPEMKAHGHPHEEERHAGDLGNIEFDNNGVAVVNFHVDKVALDGPYSISGRALVLHDMIDDYGKTEHPHSKITGNSGGAVACGVVGIM